MNLRKELPDIFDSFADARRNGFLAAKELKDKNIPLVGVFCTFLPQEIVMAMNGVVVSLCATSDETIIEAEEDLPRNLCPLIKSSYGFGKSDKCPFFYFSDLVVGETTCDGKKKMFEFMSDFKPVHVMQLPNSPIALGALESWKNEIILFRDVVEKQFDVKITEEQIATAIKLKNEERRTLKNFYELGKLNPSAISGMDLLRVLYGSTFKFYKEQAINELKELTSKIKREYADGNKLERRPRILITGSPIGGVTEKVVKAIEDNGAWVVGFENCMGAKAIEDLVDEDTDVWTGLAEKYLKIGCSCMSPNHYRFDLLGKMIKDYHVDAVVDVTLQACHTYAIERKRVKEFVNGDFNIAYLGVETDYSQTDIESLNIRLGAFIEML